MVVKWVKQCFSLTWALLVHSEEKSSEKPLVELNSVADNSDKESDHNFSNESSQTNTEQSTIEACLLNNVASRTFQDCRWVFTFHKKMNI